MKWVEVDEDSWTSDDGNFCYPLSHLIQWWWWWKMVVASKLWNINIKVCCCHTCRWDNNYLCGLQPSFHELHFWAVQWIPPVLQLPSETWYIFHELPRKWFFLVTDCMLKHWKMKAPNICFRKTQWKILSSSLLKLYQPEFHLKKWLSVVKLIGTPWASLRLLLSPCVFSRGRGMEGS